MYKICILYLDESTQIFLFLRRNSTAKQPDELKLLMRKNRLLVPKDPASSDILREGQKLESMSS